MYQAVRAKFSAYILTVFHFMQSYKEDRAINLSTANKLEDTVAALASARDVFIA